MVAIYVRNLLLNLLVLLPLIAAALLLPRLAFGAVEWLFTLGLWQAAPLIIAVGVAVPLAVLLPNLRRVSPLPKQGEPGQEPSVGIDDREARVPWYARQGTIQLGVVIPFLAAACMTATSYWQYLSRGGALEDERIWRIAILAGAVFFVYLGLIHWVGRFYRSWLKLRMAIWSLVIATIGAAAAAVGLFWSLGKILTTFDDAWLALAFGTPITLAAYSFIVVIQLGLLGAKFPDDQREWWSRLRAWTLIYSLAWAGVFTVALWVPILLLKWLGASGGVAALAGWAGSTFAGIQAGRTGAATAGSGDVSPRASARSSPSSSDRARRLALLVAPYIFVAGLLALVALAIHILLAWSFAGNALLDERLSRLNAAELMRSPHIVAYPSPILLVIVVGLAAVSMFISWRIGVNEFSMHHFYKNRLVRCYLGASRWQERKANWFTGFDGSDDLPLSYFDHRAPADNGTGAKRPWMVHPGPYPIVNAALNLVAGEDLAWQERKATSFVFTPKYCGYDIDRAVLQKDKGGHWPDAYAPTRSYVAQGVGPTLGAAMAISGAAANPNMGKVTTAASAFLMTVFNARLGWWLPNPRRKGWFGWDRSGPALGITYTADLTEVLYQAE